ncbi:PREDICTED: CAP-Gly domain-containing linker protein 2-like [Rhinopithecus bieti]|uniref:CAP-Gly domain-containing linker protein 2-like n=1 Tax=Rhinopithecus bieti TaxID=61621 RepID=UPI00083BBA9D|nr:PREDICTED: CAP-Gly domain-containing linker protein 2-like [Rhinopithecus bieti]
MSTEDALRNALDQAQQVEKLMEAMRSCPDKAQIIGNSGSANGIHQQDKAQKQEVRGASALPGPSRAGRPLWRKSLKRHYRQRCILQEALQ